LENIMSYRSHAGLHARRLFDVVLPAAIFGLVWLLPPAAQAANPAEEMFKGGRTFIDGGVDPHGDSWRSMTHSLEQFLHPEFMLRLFLSLTLAIACSWIVAWHPRSTRLASLSDLEERKTLILLGMVGAVVAELSGTSQTLAFVIFGIGALLRFRTVLDNPKLTVKAIIVVPTCESRAIRAQRQRRPSAWTGRPREEGFRDDWFLSSDRRSCSGTSAGVVGRSYPGNVEIQCT
jgi:hypothetical protein